jgi:cephalosporin hydroxylase
MTLNKKEINNLAQEIFTETALWEYLEKNTEFIIDREIQDKLLITVAPDGYLKRK